MDRRQLILAGAALAAAPHAWAEGLPDAMTLGSPAARIEVVEFASLSCGHCAIFHNEVFPAFKRKYVDTGRASFTLKEVLTAPAAIAAAGFLLARCAGKDRYFDVVSAVFRSQGEWETIGPRPSLLRVAGSFGIDEDRFDACIGDEAAREALNARVRREAEAAGIEATPTFFVNGRKVKEGVISLAELDAAIAAAGG